MNYVVSLFLVFGVFSMSLFGQGVTIGSNNPPDSSAVLDLQSTTRGFALPRLTTAQRNAINNPVFGLQIYNTDSDCLEMYFASGTWKAIECGCTAFPNAVFGLPSASLNNPVSFSAPAPNMTYAWTFQSGTPASSVAQNPQVTWSNAGTYAVSLTVTDSAGCQSSHSDSVVVSSCSPLSITFSNCGQTGQNGPSQAQCNSSYGQGVVNVSNGIQEWTVPSSGQWQIEVAGAQGGAGGSPTVGGSGAIVRGTLSLNSGDVLRILVGQQGGTQPDGGGGGGGSYVELQGGNLLMAAGGGGGGNGFLGSTRGYSDGGNGRTSTIGGNSNILSGNYGNPAPGPGGGGVAQGGSQGYGGGGAVAGGGGGYLNDGGLGSSANEGVGFLNGGAGGNGGSTNDGGFGGGGGGVSSSGYGGGGGGYSGGGGGNWNSTTHGNGGGGGSFIAPSASNVATSDGNYAGSGTLNGPIQNLGSFRVGHGYVTLTRVCP